MSVGFVFDMNLYKNTSPAYAGLVIGANARPLTSGYWVVTAPAYINTIIHPNYFFNTFISKNYQNTQNPANRA